MRRGKTAAQIAAMTGMIGANTPKVEAPQPQPIEHTEDDPDLEPREMPVPASHPRDAGSRHARAWQKDRERRRKDERDQAQEVERADDNQSHTV